MKSYFILIIKYKRLLIALLLISAIYQFLPIAIDMKRTGMYNSASELMWCTNDYYCTHEMMHYMDDKMGWPSQSDEFQAAIESLHPELYRDNQDFLVFSTGFAEIYASVFVLYFNNRDEVPDIFTSLYNWDIVDRININYDGGIYWLLFR